MGTANAQYTGQVQVTCTNGTFAVGWDNNQQFFEGKGNIAALYCDIVQHSGYVSDNLTDVSLRYYQGVIPQDIPTSIVETQTQVSSVDSGTTTSDTSTSTPQQQSATPDTATPTSDSSTATSESLTPTSESQTPVLDTSTQVLVSDSGTVLTETSTPESSTVQVPVETQTPLVTPEPVVQPEPVVVPIPQPEPQPQPVTPSEPEVITPEQPVDEVPVDEEPVETPIEEQQPDEVQPEPLPEEQQPDVPVEESPQEQTEPEPQPEIVPSVEPEPTSQPDKPFEPPIVNANSVDLSTLPPDAQVRLDNGVVLTAEVALEVQLLQNPTELFSELLTDPMAALSALGSVGADMTPEARAKSEKAVVQAVIVGSIVTQAAGAATYRRKP